MNSSASPTATDAPTFDVTAIGETMLRLSVPVGERLYDAQALRTHVGGAESNVLAAVAGLGRKVAWHSRVPDNALGQAVVRRLRAAGVDTSAVRCDREGRLGLYFLEPSAGPRGGEVVYDRAESSFSRLTARDVAWDLLLDTRVLHLTGITPALGERSLALTEEAMDRAQRAHVTVSFDVNYRRKLWPPNEASRTLLPLMKRAGLLFCGESDARELFGLNGTSHDVLGELAALCDSTNVVLTCGERGACALIRGEQDAVEAVPVHVTDPLGAGDAFAAGAIDGWLDGSLQDGLRRGAVLAAIALGQTGDMLTVTRSELTRLLGDVNDQGVHR